MRRNLVTMVVSAASLLAGGCFGDRVAYRNLFVSQYKSSQGYSGPFIVDTSQIPADMVERTESVDQYGNPVTSLTIRPSCPVKVVLLPATRP
jgi:hypothetical protein